MLRKWGDGVSVTFGRYLIVLMCFDFGYVINSVCRSVCILKWINVNHFCSITNNRGTSRTDSTANTASALIEINK